MHDLANERELQERLRLIESMMAEGRRDTESWGWIFVLWGVAYYVALAWSARTGIAWAWPATMLAAAIVTAWAAPRHFAGRPRTTMGRAVASVWIALGITGFVLFPALGLSGLLTGPHLMAALLSAILGLANGASGLILRWKAQLACAAVWWIAAAAACFGSDAQSSAVLLAAIFLGQIVFGVYGMIAHGREHRQRVSIHA